jgi:hypothetical protein
VVVVAGLAGVAAVVVNGVIADIVVIAVVVVTIVVVVIVLDYFFLNYDCFVRIVKHIGQVGFYSRSSARSFFFGAFFT